ncbi:dihydrofolate reductase [Aspergillus udagawae]|uniref:Dihydrofolate reductase n=1 Tax=Aspergillus udagawae TaxID=91492 RepID=A0A8H3RPA1_9EURO|nr:dihydrofolate reductase [Aspergillus udagawae]
MAPRQPLKLLMLHGYTQSGTLFHAKSRALIKHITKAFPLHEVSAIYPTGPIRLNPADIPGYEPPAEGSTAEQQQEQIEAYGWYRRSNTADPPLYLGLEGGLDAIAKVLREEGPFDGVIGFSQGAAMAAMVASLLEPGRKQAFEHFADPKVASEGSEVKEPVAGVAYPASFEEAGHPPLKFALCYSGFRSPGPRYRPFYENPPIQTPILHVLGSLDAVVDDTRSRALVEACAGDPEKEGKVVWHPGGHFLPSQRPYLDAAVRFIKEQLEGNQAKTDAKEDDVRDMDLPF